MVFCVSPGSMPSRDGPYICVKRINEQSPYFVWSLWMKALTLHEALFDGDSKRGMEHRSLCCCFLVCLFVGCFFFLRNTAAVDRDYELSRCGCSMI